MKFFSLELIQENFPLTDPPYCLYRPLLSCLLVWVLLLVIHGHVRNVTEVSRSSPTFSHQKLDLRSRWSTLFLIIVPTVMMLTIVKLLFLTSGKQLPCSCGLSTWAIFVKTRRHVKVDFSWHALTASGESNGHYRYYENQWLNSTGLLNFARVASALKIIVDLKRSVMVILMTPSLMLCIGWLTILGSIRSAMITLDVKLKNVRF